jgi:hypothetical protein
MKTSPAAASPVRSPVGSGRLYAKKSPFWFAEK